MEKRNRMGKAAFNPHALTWDGHTTETGGPEILCRSRAAALKEKERLIQVKRAKPSKISIFPFRISERKFNALPEADWD